ncbi:hypothetical protein EON65_47975 [archaeon]|nr:MAG: hypothetical protein EON65_47975 [archaeon]
MYTCSGVSKAEQAGRIEDQLSHIVAALEEAKADPPTWLLVAGHYPVFSAGSNGDAKELQQYLLPLLQEYHVHAYICGHDHISEHLHHQGVEFFVAGAGSMTDKLGSAGSAAEKLVWTGVEYSAFAYMKATTASLKVGFVNANGTEVYAFTLTNPHLTIPPPPSPVPVPDELDPDMSNVNSDLSLGLVLVGAVGIALYMFISRSSFMSSAKMTGKDGESMITSTVTVGPGGYMQMLKQVPTAESSLTAMEEADQHPRRTPSNLEAAAGEERPGYMDTYAQIHTHVRTSLYANQSLKSPTRSTSPLSTGSFPTLGVVPQHPVSSRSSAHHHRVYSSFL